MRVDVKCSCGATLTIGYDVSRTRYSSSPERSEAERLLEQFRRDHKPCRLSAAASAVT